jgi:hypothetical protein
MELNTHAYTHLRKPCIYASLSEMGSVLYYLAHNPYGISRASVYLWYAAWDGNPGIAAGYDIHQWLSGCCVDRDSAYAYIFGSPTPPKPKPKPLPQNYLWFTHEAPAKGLIGGPFKSPYGLVNERSEIELFDNRRLHPVQYASELRSIELKLKWLASRLLAVAHSSPAKFNTEWHRYGRVDCMLDRAAGNKVTSWSACVAWGKTH